MAENGSAPPESSLADRRPLRPGKGRSLRRTYLILTVLVVLVLAGVLSFLWYAPSSSTARDNLVLQLVATVVLGASSGCLVVAAGRGYAAIRGDVVLVPLARTSGALARVGGAIGWFGALVIVGVGLVQPLRQVESGLLQGVVLGGVALIPAVLNEAIQRMGRTIAG